MVEQATAEGQFGGTAAGREPSSSFYSLGISAFPGSTAAGKETHARQEQTKPGPPHFCQKCAVSLQKWKMLLITVNEEEFSNEKDPAAQLAIHMPMEVSNRNSQINYSSITSQF